jgi:hypothetical protein
VNVSIAGLDVRLLDTGKHVEVDRTKTAVDIDALVLVVSELALLEISDQELSIAQALERDFLGDSVILDNLGQVRRKRTYVFHLGHLNSFFLPATSVLALSTLDHVVKLGQSFVGRGKECHSLLGVVKRITQAPSTLLNHLGNHAETLLSCQLLQDRARLSSSSVSSVSSVSAVLVLVAKVFVRKSVE